MSWPQETGAFLCFGDQELEDDSVDRAQLGNVPYVTFMRMGLAGPGKRALEWWGIKRIRVSKPG